MNIKWKFAIFSLLIIFSRVTLAMPTLDIVAGQLIGAKNVDVGGTLYDVEFLNGTCVALFSGCDGSDDFTFRNAKEAHDAAQALMDTVFLDMDPVNKFDSSPELTQGCTDIYRCVVVTPYFVTEHRLFKAAASSNFRTEALDAHRTSLGYFATSADTVGSPILCIRQMEGRSRAVAAPI